MPGFYASQAALNRSCMCPARPSAGPGLSGQAALLQGRRTGTGNRKGDLPSISDPTIMLPLEAFDGSCRVKIQKHFPAAPTKHLAMLLTLLQQALTRILGCIAPTKPAVFKRSPAMGNQVGYEVTPLYPAFSVKDHSLADSWPM